MSRRELRSWYNNLCLLSDFSLRFVMKYLWVKTVHKASISSFYKGNTATSSGSYCVYVSYFYPMEKRVCSWRLCPYTDALNSADRLNLIQQYYNNNIFYLKFY